MGRQDTGFQSAAAPPASDPPICSRGPTRSLGGIAIRYRAAVNMSGQGNHGDVGGGEESRCPIAQPEAAHVTVA
jgi:hypothetical protein